MARDLATARRLLPGSRGARGAVSGHAREHRSLSAQYALDAAAGKMIDGVEHGRLWTEGMLNIAPASIVSVRILSNNIVVSLFAFCAGIFSIIRYTLTEQQYCEWIEYTTRNNLDAPGVTNQAPPVSSHCTPIRKAGDSLIFAPPGESVITTYDRNGFTAVIKGQFTDHWRKVN
jgi:hypothetical protein